MSLLQGTSGPHATPEGAQPVPFAAVMVTLTKQEHIRLLTEACSIKRARLK
jgi:hypothetical protein